jgi:predicted metalloprotease with PDZ domain
VFRLPLFASLLLLSPVGVAVRAAPAAAPHYEVSVPATRDALRVAACFEVEGTLRLHRPSARAVHLLDDLQAGPGARVALDADGIRLELPKEGGCLRYRVRLEGPTVGGQWRTDFLRTTDAVLVSPDLFLWLPDDAADVTVEFGLVPGDRVSAPWKKLDPAGRRALFRVGERSGFGDGKVAIGPFASYRLALDDAVIEVALLDGVPPLDVPMIRRWLEANIAAVTALNGRFPVPRLQLLVIPLGSGDEPVPWGQVTRGGGDAVHLYIDQRMSEQAFMDDWVLSHELSHLFHPFLGGNARWVYEGLASYYQNVSRARTGMLAPHEAWTALHAGFERGRRGTRAGRTLSDAAARMRAERAYMQVYWSGAAIFLLADIELRDTSAQRQSLDRVLGAFADCCLLEARDWTGRDFLEQLDRLSGSDVFTRLAAAHRDSDRFPELAVAYERLGLRPLSDGGLAFDDGPRQAALRAAIMGSP